MNDNKTVRTATQKEQDDINLQYLELEIRRSKLALRELEIQYQELQGKLEVQSIMEADRWNLYNIVPSQVDPDMQTNGITPPPGPVEDLYTTVTERLCSINIEPERPWVHPAFITKVNFGPDEPKNIQPSV